MAVVINGSTGITFPAGGTGNPAGTVVGTTDTQTLSGKTISGNLNMTGGSKYQVSGVTTNALAWVNFNGTTSPGTIRSQYNVSSVTKNGTGDYTVNFTNALSDANYVTVLTGRYTSGTMAYPLLESATVPTTTTVRIVNQTYNSGGYTDTNYFNVAIFGN